MIGLVRTLLVLSLLASATLGGLCTFAGAQAQAPQAVLETAGVPVCCPPQCRPQECPPMGGNSMVIACAE